MSIRFPDSLASFSDLGSTIIVLALKAFGIAKGPFHVEPHLYMALPNQSNTG